jgi:hypothetical protein
MLIFKEFSGILYLKSFFYQNNKEKGIVFFRIGNFRQKLGKDVVFLEIWRNRGKDGCVLCGNKSKLRYWNKDGIIKYNVF